MYNIQLKYLLYLVYTLLEFLAITLSSHLCQDLPMQSVLRDIPSSAALTPEPVMGGDQWAEHQHLMNPMFLQSPDEIDLPPLDPELLEHRRHQVRDIARIPTLTGRCCPQGKVIMNVSPINNLMTTFLPLRLS